MKKITSLFALCCLISLYGKSQFDAPAVEWKIHDIPPASPNSPLIVPSIDNPGAGFQPGDPLLEPDAPFPTHKTGEDWWYSITPAIVGGQEVGYYTAGYATWMYYDMDETSSGGCKIDYAEPNSLDPLQPDYADLSRPIKLEESLSTKLGTVALYDKKGKMVWCKAFVPGREGAYSCKADSDGNVIITGWTSFTRNVHGGPLLFNPKVGFTGYDLSVESGSTPGSTLCESNKNKAFIAKISPTGDLIWSYIYSMYDLNGSFDNEHIVSLTTQGTDLVIADNGNYVITGVQLTPYSFSTEGVFVLEVNENGEIVNRSELNVNGYSAIPKGIAKKANGDYLIGGYAQDVFTYRAHGFIANYNKNTLIPSNSGIFGTSQIFSSITTNTAPLDNINTDMIWNENIDDGYAAGVNVVRDVKELSNGNIVSVSLEDCSGCTFSGPNSGIGKLRIHQPNGASLIPNYDNSGDAEYIINNDPSRDGRITAFDIMIGLEADDPNEITLITTVDEGKINNHPDFNTTFKNSMEVINPGGIEDYKSYVSESFYQPRGGGQGEYFDVARTSALLANYSIDGELRWEKVIDIDDADLQVYPGDWKEQECVYQVMKDQDGAYIFVGNTSHNKDDYLVAKVFGNCQLDIDYDLEPTNPAVNNVIEITNSTTWDQAYWGGQSEIDVRGEVHIKAGATLYINDLKVRFASSDQMVYDTKLIVEAGARLIVQSGSELTSNDCPGALWSGVEVWGNRNQRQNSLYQGTLTMNNATISHARNGVKPWKPDSWGQTGGIIRATNSFFTDNSRDVEFISYRNIQPNGTEHPNQSFFRNCEFKTKNSFKLDRVSPHVTLFDVHGVRFERCDFEDERVLNDPARKGKGIFSIDANYKILGTFTGSTSTTVEYYDETNFDVCKFTNLLNGVEAMNANSQETIIVDHAKFTDCRFGVRLSGVDNAMITRNFFNETSAGMSAPSYYGILLEKSTAFQVEGNVLQNSNFNGTGGMIGISISNSGLENNEVYKNQLINNHYATYSFARNRNNANINDPNLEGLEFLCNDHSGNIITDEVVYGFFDTDGEKLVQGVFNAPTWNVLTNPSSGITNQLSNYIDEDLYYIHNNLSSDEIPTIYTSGIAPVSLSKPRLCPTTFNTINPSPGPVISSVSRALLEAKFGTIRAEYISKKMVFDQLITNGDRQELHDVVANVKPNNKHQVKSLLLASSPYLSKSVLIELADQSKYPNSWLKDMVIANIDIARERDFREYLLNKQSPMPYGLYKKIEDELGAITERTEKQHELVALNREKDRTVNIILKDITLDSLGIDYNQFKTWTINRADVFCEAQIADNYLSKGMKDECNNHLTYIDGQVFQVTDNQVKLELGFYSTFKKEMIELTNDAGTLEGLNELAESRVRYYAENAEGLAQVQAQNLLCFFLGECTDAPPIPTGGAARMMESNDNTETAEVFTELKTLIIYPNPTQGKFTISSTEYEDGEIIILDLNGRIVYRMDYSENKRNIDLTEVESGIYMVQLVNNGELVGLEKLIKQ